MKNKEEKPRILNIENVLVRQYYEIQRHRISMGLQLYSSQAKRIPRKDAILKNGHPISKEEFTRLETHFEGLLASEKLLLKDIGAILKDHLMADWLDGIKGIGPTIGLALVGTLDPTKTKHVSSFWKYCGMSPDSIRKKGVKVDYNPFAKQICFKLGESFIKCGKGQKYRQRYDDCKALYKANRQDHTPKHLDYMARRKAVKLFLADFWVEWRTRLNLPVSEPYSHKYGSNYKS